MNVVDSSAWLEYFADGQNGEFFASTIENTDALLVPTITLYEVFKRMSQQLGENHALHAVAAMQQGTVVEVTAPIAVSAARISLQKGLPLADSLILATARTHGATLWTQDSDFAEIEGVKYKPKSAPAG